MYTTLCVNYISIKPVREKKNKLLVVSFYHLNKTKNKQKQQIQKTRSLYSSFFHVKSGYKLSFDWQQTLSPADSTRQILNLISLLSSQIFTFPQFAALRSLKLFIFVLISLYKFIVLCDAT